VNRGARSALAAARSHSAKKAERRFRDMHAIAQQIQTRDNHYEDVGRVLLDASATIPRGPTN
jgi:indole-3-acetate monooxygenase